MNRPLHKQTDQVALLRKRIITLEYDLQHIEDQKIRESRERELKAAKQILASVSQKGNT